MLKREAKRLQNKYGKLLDPLGLFILISLFVLPALALVNLSPKANSSLKVLGTESKPGIGIVLVGGVHDYIKDERISFPTESNYVYAAEIIKHGVGEYSKPILQVTNFSDNKDVLKITGGTEELIGSKIYLGMDNNKYLLQDEKGNGKTVDLTIPESSKPIIYLVLETNTPLFFNEEITVDIVKK